MRETSNYIIFIYTHTHTPSTNMKNMKKDGENREKT